MNLSLKIEYSNSLSEHDILQILRVLKTQGEFDNALRVLGYEDSLIVPYRLDPAFPSTQLSIEVVAA